MIEIKGVIIGENINMRCANSVLRSRKGKEYCITNCHLLLPPKFVYNG